MLNVVMLSVVMLNVVMLSVVMLNVVAPKKLQKFDYFRRFWPRNVSAIFFPPIQNVQPDPTRTLTEASPDSITRAQCYKTFYGRKNKLECFSLSNVCGQGCLPE